MAHQIVKQRQKSIFPTSSVLKWVGFDHIFWLERKKRKNLRFVSFSFVFIVVQLLLGLLVTTYSYSIHLVRMSNDQTYHIQRRINDTTYIFFPVFSYFFLSFPSFVLSGCLLLHYFLFRLCTLHSLPYSWVSVFTMSSS